jgi:hypothetical protein
MLRPGLADARLKGRLGRLLFAIATIAQLVGVLAGPMDHWRANSKIGAHIEESGSQLAHYQHNEATCTACAIGQTLARAARRAEVSLPWAEATAASFRVVEWVAFHERRYEAVPRAGPTGSRVS